MVVTPARNDWSNEDHRTAENHERSIQTHLGGLPFEVCAELRPLVGRLKGSSNLSLARTSTVGLVGRNADRVGAGVQALRDGWGVFA